MARKHKSRAYIEATLWSSIDNEDRPLIAMHGLCDEENRDVTGYGPWYGLIRGPINISKIEPDNRLTQKESEFLERISGAILSEDSQGFRKVDFYSNPEELENEWSAIGADIAACDEDGDEA